MSQLNNLYEFKSPRTKHLKSQGLLVRSVKKMLLKASKITLISGQNFKKKAFYSCKEFKFNVEFFSEINQTEVNCSLFK